jgi:hypothetical protein
MAELITEELVQKAENKEYTDFKEQAREILMTKVAQRLAEEGYFKRLDKANGIFEGEDEDDEIEEDKEDGDEDEDEIEEADDEEEDEIDEDDDEDEIDEDDDEDDDKEKDDIKESFRSLYV